VSDQQAQEAMRAEFEEFCDDRCLPTVWMASGAMYASDDTHAAWEAWQHQQAKLKALASFARDVLSNWPEGGIDGADLQELGIKHGLLILKSPGPKEPCGEDCMCAEYFSDAEWAQGVPCYRYAEALNA
jgi:hypothetical protein